MQKIISTFKKITKIVASRAAVFGSDINQIVLLARDVIYTSRLARDVIYTSRAYTTMSVCICL